MDFLDRLKAHIESLSTYADKVDIGKMSDGNSITIRPAPSIPPVEHLDRGKMYTYSFQVLNRHSSQPLTHNTQWEIHRNLVNLSDLPSGNGSYRFVRIATSNQPSYLERDNEGWVYTALYNAEIYIK